ncbi:MAG TPA: hypothetical protein GXZ48_04625 [Acholeplasmataceae bacterium]|nr:hypothetical protein [Acholeplasmataceae bacterium]
MYCAMMVDIKDSQKLKQDKRIKIQKKLIDVIALLNKTFVNQLKYKLVFNSGDSVQGLFYKPFDALKYYFSLKDLLYPYEVRLGLGVGSIVIDFENYDSNMQDGPAYHNALSALKLAKKENVDAIIETKTKLDYYVNELLYILFILENSQSNNQKDVNNLINLLLPVGYKIPFTDLQKYLLTNISQYDKIEISNLDEYDLIDKKSKFSKNIYMPSLALKISKLLGTSRENIRQIIKNGKINEIRKLRELILKFLEEKENEITT